MTHTTAIPPAARFYGLAGLLPFLAGLGLTLFGQNEAQQSLGLLLFVAYGATILAFLGGIRWGAALSLPNFHNLGMAVAPSLLAFLALLLDPAMAVNVLGTGFVVVGIFDRLRRLDDTWPAWFRALRTQLTLAVVSLHLIVALSLK